MEVFFSLFKIRQTTIQRGRLTCPRSHSKSTVELGCVSTTLPSPKGCPWLHKKVTSIKLLSTLATPSALASPEASLGMCVPEAQGIMWKLGDNQARLCQDVRRKPSLLKAGVCLGQGGGRTRGCTFSPAQQAVGFLLPC